MAGLCISALRERGHDVDAMLDALHIPRAAAVDPNVPLPLDALVAIYDEAERVTSDPIVGIHAGITQRTGTLNDYLLLNAPSPRAYIECLVRFAPLLTTTLRWSAEDDGSAGEYVRVSVEIPGAASCMGRHANEGVLARLLLMLRLHSAEHDCVAKAELAHAAPKCAERVRESLSVDVDFSRGRNSAWFRKDLLDATSPVADPALHRVLRGYAEQELAPVDVKRPFSSQVRQRLSLEIRERLPTLFSVAEGLAMSPRTVQAKLAEEESSFAAVLDDVREGIARKALAETELSLWDIAVRLHYSDLSAFVRAFRRWTGTTPARFRSDAA